MNWTHFYIYCVYVYGAFDFKCNVKNIKKSRKKTIYTGLVHSFNTISTDDVPVAILTPVALETCHVTMARALTIDVTPG